MSVKINPVSITENAANEINNILDKKDIPKDYGLRIGIKGGVGCAGANYVLGFDRKQDYDNEFEVRGFKLYIDKRHTMFLMGVTLDFYNGADARGFKFLKEGGN